MNRITSTYQTQQGAAVAPNLVRWGAVFSGTVIALAFFALVSTLWLGIAYQDGDGSGWISGNLAWFIAGTAIASLFLAGLLAGLLSGVRGASAGAVNGMTAWGLLFVASLLTVVPSLAAITNNLGAGLAAGTNELGSAIGQSGAGVTAASGVWATFWSLLIGAVAAALGGMLGGKMKREVEVADVDTRGAHAYPAEPTSVDVDEEPVVIRSSGAAERR